MIASEPCLICYPPAPLNGGPLEHAPAKIGAWVWHPKVDDRRVMIHTPTRTIWNQYGQLSVADDSGKFEPALDMLQALPECPMWLDAGLMEYRHDMMRGCIVIFDMVAPMRFSNRRAYLETFFETLPMAAEIVRDAALARDRVYLINQYAPAIPPIHLQAMLQLDNQTIGRKFYEGLVAKRADSLYPMGLRPKQKTPDWIKHRFDQ